MSDYLPDELLADILSRLPVKSLLWYRCVCKRWSKIITSSSFAADHLTRSTSKESDRVLLRCRSYGGAGKEHFFLTQDEGFLPKCNFEELDCPFKSQGEYCTYIVGACNGLICLSDDSLGFSDRFALWNPSIRRVVHIPRPNFGFESGTHFMYALGFGFDSISDDYKLVRVLYLKEVDLGLDIPLADVTPVVEVFSLRSRSWRFVPNGLKYVMGEISNSALLNGACHWLAYTPDRMYLRIVSFHFGDEVFGEFALPRLLDRENGTVMTFGVLDGCLAMIPYNGLPVLEDCSVWVMKEYGNARSWTKLFKIETHANTGNLVNIEDPINIERDQIQRLIAFRKNGEVLLAKQSGELVTCHPTTKESRSCNIWGHVNAFHFDTFIESLVLLREANAVAEVEDGDVANGA